MGLFSSLFGTQTNAASNAATNQALGSTTLTHNVNEDALRGLNLNAQGAITGYGGQALGAVNNATANSVGALTSQGAQAQQQIANGVNSAVGTVQGSNAAYQPYQQAGQGALSMLMNSYGLNGPGGNAAAQSAFQAGPGYQWQQDQATDAASRHAAALGMAGSGNTLDAITRLSSNLANQEYGQWQNGLSGLTSTGMAANNAVTANNATAAGYQYGGGLAGGQLSQQLGSSLGNAYQNQGQQQSGIYSNMGSALSGLNTSLGSQLVSNNDWATGFKNAASIVNANQQDAATNYNNGIFSRALGALGSDFFGGTASGKTLSGKLQAL